MAERPLDDFRVKWLVVRGPQIPVSEKRIAMYNGKPEATRPFLLLGIAGLMLAITLATVTTGWLLLEVRKEQRTISELLQSGLPAVQRSVGTMPVELGWQFSFSVLVLLVLVATALAVMFMLRAYLVSQHSLAEVTVLSRNVLASMDHAVLTTDRRGRLASVNPRGCELLGITDSQRNHPLKDLCGQDMPLDAISRGVFCKGEAIHDRDFAISRNGRVQRLRADAHLLRDSDGRVIGTVLHVRDVTERHLMEERLRRMERYVGLGSLAAGLHHEIKNPLGALSLHIQLLEERLDGVGDNEVIENLGVLKTEVTRISGVLESFHDFASSNRLDRSPTDILKTMEAIVRLIHPQARQQHVRLEFSAARDLPEVLVDAAKLEQVVLNLVLNALDEMPDGGTLTIRLEADRRTCHIYVGDTGPGIPPQVQSRLFDPYFTTKSTGSGMGLALSEKIVQLHGGSIDYQTGPEGTVFHVAIPRHGA